MAHAFDHTPVLSQEVVALFAPVPTGVLVDATVGGGGHSAALLAARDDLTLIGLDRDPVALEAARQRLAPFGDRVTLVHGAIDRIELWNPATWTEKVQPEESWLLGDDEDDDPDGTN